MTLKINAKNHHGRWNIYFDDTPLGYIKKYGSRYYVLVEIDYYKDCDINLNNLSTLKEAKDFVRQNLATQESFARTVGSAIANRKFA